MATILPPNHRRSISTTAQIVEKTLCEIEDILLLQHSNNKATVIQQSYTEKQRSELIDKINELKQLNGELILDFDLQKMIFTESQLLQSKTTFLWAVLMDSKAKKMKGYGKLSPVIAEKLDIGIDILIKKLDRLLP